MSIVLVFHAGASGVWGQDLQIEQIYEWGFQKADDRNVDQEPDGWRRRRDRQHPAYISSKIVSRDPSRAYEANIEQLFAARLMHAVEQGKWDSNFIPESIPAGLAELMDRHVFDNCLEINMDGGSAELVSPVFPMDSRFSYYLQAEIDCHQLNGHRAWVELQLLNQDQQSLGSLATPALVGTTDWRRVSTELASAPSNNPSNELRWGRVHIKVETLGKMLIHGRARFDSIRIYRLPRLNLTTALPYHIALPDQQFDVTCAAMGIRGDGSSVRFELRDHLDQLLLSEAVELVPVEAAAGATPQGSSSASDGRVVRLDGRRAGPHFVHTENRTADLSEVASARGTYDGNATWSLRLAQPGLYRVNVVLGEGSQSQVRNILIGVMPAITAVQAGPFGWSIATLEGALRPEELPLLVQQFGAGWIKFPVWFEVTDVVTADRLEKMIERLQMLGTRCVGRIEQPPASQRSIFGEGSEPLQAVSIFRTGRVWEPLLEPVLTRIGPRLDWFQIGSDEDRSFQSHPQMHSLITDIRSRMQTYSQDLKLAICWTWQDQEPEVAVVPWNVLHYSTAPELTATELLSYATQNGRKPKDVWTSLDPLDQDRYGLLDRVRDLTERMVVVKRCGIPAAFVSDPFHAQHGLFGQDKTIGEMLIPWTTLVHALGEKEYMGSVELPGGSQNYAFQSSDEGIMLLWNDVTATEQLFLGTDVTAIDVWGREVEVQQRTGDRGYLEQRIEVSRWPIIVRGIDPHVVRWRQKFEIEIPHLSSSVSEGQRLPVTVVNTLGHAAVGTLSLVSESLLGTSVAELPLHVPLDGRRTAVLPLDLRPDASTGKHKLRFDVNVAGDEPYRFSVYRQITLGTGDIEFHWDVSRKTPELVELRVELLNNTEEPRSFDCKYFPVGKPYQRFQVLQAPPGVTLRTINLKLTQAEENEGAWIRCEEIGTGRVLNYRLRP